MMAGAGVAAQRINQPFDSLSFAPTVMNLVGPVPK